MRRRILLFLVVFACPLVVLLLYVELHKSPSPSLNRVAAWMPSSWDGTRARASWEANRDHIHEISPVWYRINASGDGSIDAYAGARDADLVARAHAQSILVIPLINNAYDSTGMDAEPVSRMLHDPGLRAAHIVILLNEVLTHNYDGIDIDYEALNGASDREAFSAFIEELAMALHVYGKLLSVTVHAKTYEPGGWNGPQAQDWARIGAVADRFRVMTYAYHSTATEPGPIAPLWWMEDVIRFATSVVPSHKVYVGIHFYGHDWTPGANTSVTWSEAQQRLASHGAAPQWQESEGWRHAVAEPWFTYVDGVGRRHEVWYADGRSVNARLELVHKYGLGGIAVWRLGGEDPASWEAIATALPPATPTPPPTAP